MYVVVLRYIGRSSWAIRRRVDLNADSITKCFERATGELCPIVVHKRPWCSETTENSLFERLLEIRGSSLP